jgi:hypothetical protein
VVLGAVLTGANGIRYRVDSIAAVDLCLDSIRTQRTARVTVPGVAEKLRALLLDDADLLLDARLALADARATRPMISPALTGGTT